MGENFKDSTVESLNSRVHLKNEELDFSDEHKKVFDKWIDRECLSRCLQANAFMNLQEEDLLEKTLEQIFATIDWRVSFKVDQIDPNKLGPSLRCGEAYLSPGRGKLGQPIFIFKKVPSRKQYDPNYVKAAVYLMEEAVRQMDSNCSMKKWIVLSDLRNWTPQNMLPLSLARELVSILQNHYRERLFRVYVINAPWYFNVTWNLLRPLMDPDTVKKIRFLSAPPQGTPLSTFFEEDIEITHLENHFGGELEFDFNFERDILGMTLSESMAVQRKLAEKQMVNIPRKDTRTRNAIW
eukprot:CAMPEP_0117755726 /NCGR_PEP_ID=MMETSP0947-20121206/13624_1 /TAXON_ID=44440 /ORGANISM="Chattonella subsalsa, Strain CCMP2191" /LENGTH=294 /DNA_ID=CAMNT_0005575117 /DNA_START=54 /DNA_END=935 /DNA_ORIENTATION=+